jgi:hypothetical protein
VALVVGNFVWLLFHCVLKKIFWEWRLDSPVLNFIKIEPFEKFMRFKCGQIQSFFSRSRSKPLKWVQLEEGVNKFNSLQRHVVREVDLSVFDLLILLVLKTLPREFTRQYLVNDYTKGPYIYERS